MKKVCIIGGGAAGLMAAVTAADDPQKEVVLFERNSILGKKLLLTGNGRCNITNLTDIKNIIENTPGNGKFLYSALNNLSSYDLIDFFENNGLKLKIEQNNRVFPVTDKSSDVVDTFKNLLNKKGVTTFFNERAEKIYTSNKKIIGLKTNKRKMNCDSIIIATGGKTYPRTGSSGDGYNLAAELGHSIIKPRPSLVALETHETWVSNLQGLTLKNVIINLLIKGKSYKSISGDLLFTHFGVSGPAVLNLSRDVVENLDKNNYTSLCIDLKPTMKANDLKQYLKTKFQKQPNKLVKNILKDLFPLNFAIQLLKIENIDENKPANQITKEERAKLVALLKGLILTVSKPRPWSEAIITNGGINTREINPKTMESKLIKGLFFAGEVIDVDAYTGGFNLQAAFSTGYTAGRYSGSCIKSFN